MGITIVRRKENSFVDFIENNNISVIVNQTRNERMKHKWIAYVENGVVNGSTSTNGKSPEEAVNRLAHKISNKILWIKRHEGYEEEIKVPDLDPDFYEERRK